MSSKSLDNNVIMIDGATSRKSYCAFARRGDIVLGLKFGGVQHLHGAPLAGVILRLKSTEGAAKIFSKEDQVSSVVDLGDAKVTHKDAFNFPWEKDRGYYSSTSISYFLKLSTAKPTQDEFAQFVVDNFKNGSTARSVANALMSGIDPKYYILQPVELAAWLQGYFDKIVADYEQHVVMSAEVAKIYESYAGTVANGADIKAKIQARKKELFPEPEPQAKAEDADDGNGINDGGDDDNDHDDSDE